MMRMLGRLTAPIMAFFIVEGFINTRSWRKYFLRLLIFAFISQPFYFVMIISRPPINVFEFVTNLNVMFTFCLSLVSLMILSSEKLSLIAKTLLIGVCFAAADICDWSYIVPAWTIIFFLFRNSNIKKATAFISVSVLLLVLRFYPMYESFRQFSYQLGVILSLIPLNLYNGERSRSSSGIIKKLSKWSFYIYYPLHIAILLIVKFYVIGDLSKG